MQAATNVLLTAIDPWRGQIFPGTTLTREHLSAFLREASPHLHEIASGVRPFSPIGLFRARRMLDVAIHQDDLGITAAKQDHIENLLQNESPEEQKALGEKLLAQTLLQANQRLNPDVDHEDLAAASRELDGLIGAPAHESLFVRVMTLLHRYGPRLQNLTEQGKLAKLLERPDWREVFAEPLLELLRHMEGVSLFQLREGSATVFAEKLTESDPDRALLELVRLIHEVYVVMEQRQANPSASIVNAPTMLAVVGNEGLSTGLFAEFTSILGGRQATAAAEVFPVSIPPYPSEPAIDKEMMICQIVYGQDSSPSFQTHAQQQQVIFLRDALDDEGFLRVQGNSAGGGEAVPKWKVKKVLGEGGMAVALLAEDMVLGDVVIKIAHKVPEGMKEKYYGMFQNEQRIQGRVRGSTHTLTVYDYGYTLAGHPLVVLEYAKGGNLDDLIDQDPPLSLADQVRVLTGVAEGIADIHQKGVVHRDIKPENVFIAQDSPNGQTRPFDSTKDRPVVADYGIAVLIKEAPNDKRVIGSGGYIAPEIMPLKGPPPQYTPASDVFALAATAYAVLTGKNPFLGREVYNETEKKWQWVGGLLSRLPELWATIEADPEIDDAAKFLLQDLNQKGAEAGWEQLFSLGYLAKYVRPPHELNPEIPERLSRLIMRGLAVDPADRYADAEEFRQALLDYQKWTEANQHWQEAMTKLAHAEGARHERNMTTWADLARAAFYKAVDAIRIYRDPEWVAQIMTVLYQTLKHAEATADVLLRRQILQDMDMIKGLIPSNELTNHPLVERGIRKAHEKGGLDITLGGLPADRSVRPRVTLFPLNETDGVVQLGTPVDLSDQFSKPGSRGQYHIRIALPYGSFALDFGPDDQHPTSYAPMRLLIQIQRGKAVTHELRLLRTDSFPSWMAPMPGGLVNTDHFDRRFNLPPKNTSSLVPIRPFLISKYPLTYLQYLEALLTIALQKGVDEAVRYQIRYSSDKPYWYQTDQLLQKLMAIYKRHSGKTVGQFLEEIHQAGLLNDMVDEKRSPILWKAPATWLRRSDLVEAIIPALLPQGRLPTTEEMIWLIAGDRETPWGRGEPKPGWAHVNNLGLQHGGIKQLPVGRTMLMELAESNPEAALSLLAKATTDLDISKLRERLKRELGSGAVSDEMDRVQLIGLANQTQLIELARWVYRDYAPHNPSVGDVSSRVYTNEMQQVSPDDEPNPVAVGSPRTTGWYNPTIPDLAPRASSGPSGMIACRIAMSLDHII